MWYMHARMNTCKYVTTLVMYHISTPCLACIRDPSPKNEGGRGVGCIWDGGTTFQLHFVQMLEIIYVSALLAFYHGEIIEVDWRSTWNSIYRLDRFILTELWWFLLS